MGVRRLEIKIDSYGMNTNPGVKFQTTTKSIDVVGLPVEGYTATLVEVPFQQGRRKRCNW